MCSKTSIEKEKDVSSIPNVQNQGRYLQFCHQLDDDFLRVFRTAL